MRFAFTTQPIEIAKDGTERLDLYVRDAKQLGMAAPEVTVSWKRGAKTDWEFDNLSVPSCTIEQAEGVNRVLGRFVRLLENKDLDANDADAVIVHIERAGGFHIVWDPRVKKNVKVTSLEDGKGSQYIAKVGEEILASTMAEDEDEARDTLVKIIQRTMVEAEDEEKIDLCAKWFKAKKKIIKTMVTGNAPKVHPIEGYLKRGAAGHKRMEQKKQKESA